MQISSLWSIKEEFRTKVLLLAFTFGFLTATQAIWRSLKASIFAKIVGAAHAPDAKIMAVFFLIPLILGYSKLVDSLRRHHIVYWFTLLHGIGGLIFAYYFTHPTLGLANTDASPDRFIGWAFYMFMESFSAFLATTFWSFANSINKPKDAKNYYGFFVTGSKIGGLLSAGLFYLFLQLAMTPNNCLAGWCGYNGGILKDEIILPTALIFGSMMLFLAALCIYLLMQWVPGYYMHGYEAVYQVEKQRMADKEEAPFSFAKWAYSLIEGLMVIITHPYVFGIFCLSLFHDIVMTIFDFMVMMEADSSYDTAGKMALFYGKYFTMVNFIGLLITLFGTTPLQRLLGNRTTLLVYPLLCMGLVVFCFFFPTPNMFFIAIVLLRAFNYGFNHPVREVLYIPTTKDIKFKSKAWTDAFGTRIAKTTGSLFYKNVSKLSGGYASLLVSGFTFSITIAWVIISYFLGRTLQDTLDQKKIIGDTGAEQQEETPSTTFKNEKVS